MHVASSRTVTPMIADLHGLQITLLCQLSKSTPNILWSVGSSLHNQFLQVGSENPAVMVARLSLNSMLGRHAGKTPPAAATASRASLTSALSRTTVRAEKAARA
jgi:hypothetical protein